jgi:hypothetical protein
MNGTVLDYVPITLIVRGQQPGRAVGPSTCWVLQLDNRMHLTNYESIVSESAFR